MYNKICKYKKIILLCLVFTLSFNLISVKQEKEVQAVALIDDAILWTLGLLVLSTGVVALNSEQIMDMGSQVYDKLSLDEEAYKEAIYGTTEQQAENDEMLKQRFVRVTDKLKNIVNEVADTLTTEDKIVTEYGTYNTNVMELNLPFIKNSQGLYDTYLNVTIPEHLKAIVYTFSNGRTFTGTFPVGSEGKKVTLIGEYNTTEYKRFILNDLATNTQLMSGFLSMNGFESIFNELFVKKIEILYEDGYYGNAAIEVGNSTTIPYSDKRIKEGYNPTYTNENLKNDTYHPIPTTVPTDTAISTDMPLDWEQAKAKGLVTDIPASDVRQLTGDFTGDLTGDITGTLENGFSLRIPNIFEMLKELLIYLFYPTVSVADLFSIPAGSGFAGLVDLFNWDSLFNIEPKPYEFVTDMDMNTLLGENEGSKTWHIELKLFDTQFMKNNIGIVRNVLSYSLLISVIYFVVYHFIPRRDMD